MKNLLIVMSGPSGVGKGTIVRELMKKGDFALSVSCTTRKPRESEIDGVSYFFITKSSSGKRDFSNTTSISKTITARPKNLYKVSLKAKT